MTMLVAVSLLTVDPQIDAAKGVLSRTIGSPAKSFQLGMLPARPDGLDAFEVEASGGTVTVKGTSAVAICRGAYEYLKDACHVQFTWNGMKMKVPTRLPDYAKRDVVGPNKWRHYFNICTFGYTTVWWDWKRWEKEIDWMALHGINMPLAMTGQDKVWQTVFKGYGVPQASLDKFFSGPAFLPWHWMGNLNGHGGGLPQSWIDGQATLQKKILGRERSLGMKPVVPGFSGFVPTDFSKFQPSVKLNSPTAWCGFDPTTFVAPNNPKFVEIGKRFIQEYKKEFGTDHFYLCDTFNEQNPQFPAATESDDLAACGKSVMDAIREADPEGVWVMQGWLFYNEARYWTVPRVESLFREVPQGKMIVLDLATNESAVWRRLPPVRKMGWIYNTLHNYGQTTGLHGNLGRFAARAAEDLNDPEHGNFLGMGLTPEGIEQNPAVYEITTDAMWTRKAIDAKAWTESYVTSRYGKSVPNAQAAWNILLETIYNQDLAWYRAQWRLRPSDGRVTPSPYDADKLAQAVTLLLACPELKGNERYQRDLVDVTKTWLGVLADLRLASALVGKDYDPKLAGEQRTKFFALLDAIDETMATQPEHRLSTWINDAKRWGKNDAERRQMEENARTQVTVWGKTVLYDYANKEWAGLTKDFLKARWQAYFDTNGKVDLANWELDWTKRTTPPVESKAGDPYAVCKRIFDTFKAEPTTVTMPLGLDDEPGIAVGKPVRDSGHENGHNPQAIVDGHVLGNYWAASPYPQWVEIDLQAVRSLDGVTLHPYFNDDRKYKYRAEVSTDRNTWTTVAEGEGLATIKGYRHKFTALSGRYVKVTMLSNSANVGVHLQEVRVYGK